MLGGCRGFTRKVGTGARPENLWEAIGYNRPRGRKTLSGAGKAVAVDRLPKSSCKLSW